MALTKLQKHLAAGMKGSGLTSKETATLICGLETERQQQEMADWMYYHIKTYDGYPKLEMYPEAVVIIRDNFSKTKAG